MGLCDDVQVPGWLPFAQFQPSLTAIAEFRSPKHMRLQLEGLRDSWGDQLRFRLLGGC